MTSLEPVFRLLVRTLSEQRPPRIHEPIAVNELIDSLLPYRLVRRELGVDTAEDYETILFRLCAGEGDFVQAEPATQAALAAELKKPLPDLALLRVYGDTHLVLRTDSRLSAAEVRPEQRYAPPGTQAPAAPRPEPGSARPPEKPGHEAKGREAVGRDPDWPVDPVVELRSGPAAPVPPEPSEEPDDAVEPGKLQVRCPFCGGLLPPRMMINFCPHCGMGQDVGTCRNCGADMDVGWRYCVSCGEEVRGGPA